MDVEVLSHEKPTPKPRHSKISSSRPFGAGHVLDSAQTTFLPSSAHFSDISASFSLVERLVSENADKKSLQVDDCCSTNCEDASSPIFMESIDNREEKSIETVEPIADLVQRRDLGQIGEKTGSSSRRSDLIWFNSGVPPDFSRGRFDAENYAVIDDLITKANDVRISKAIYPDLSDFYTEKAGQSDNLVQSTLEFKEIESKEPSPSGSHSSVKSDEIACEKSTDFVQQNGPLAVKSCLSTEKSCHVEAAVSPGKNLPPILQKIARSPISVPHCSFSAPMASNVCYVGWLTWVKNNNLRKNEYIRRWCRLNSGKIVFYAGEADEKSLDTVDCKNVLFVNAKASSHNELLFSFDLYHLNHYGKVEQLTLMADCEKERTVWTTFLARCLVVGEACDICQNVDRAGRVILKKGTTADWENGWLLMIGRTILYSCENDGCTFEIDVRKVIRIRPSEDIAEHSRLSKHANISTDFVVATEGSSLYIQTKHWTVTEAWKNAINFVLTQRTSVLCDQRLTFDDVPVLVEKCINFIAIHGIGVEGIHRLSGTASKVRTLFDDFQRDPHAIHLLLDEYNVHDVASVLRKFFRQLREPLITNEFRSKFIDTACISETGSRHLACKSLLHKLPLVNFRTMRRILAHLKCVADSCNVNMMSVQNLAAIFGPTLFTVDRDALEGSDFTSTTQSITLTADMILYFNWLFDVEEAEVEKETLIQQAANDLAQNHQKKKKLAGELLLSIYTDHREGACFNMQISKKLTADEVCKFTAEREKILNSKRNEIALFEVVCKGELERLMCPDENVLDVISRWTTWPLEERATNYLIVKEDYVTSRVKDMAFGLTLYPSSEFLFSDNKAFRRAIFKYLQGTIVQLKDAKSPKILQEWNGEDLLWYFGCETKRQPPTKHCLTFITKNEQIKRSKTHPFFGKTMCFKTDKELYKWLCTVLLINVNIPF